ncbi:MAG TPA: N,N-dimethylformamidase beta subunit family domain-containing protein [Chloroflexia bacterium]|nr:N,N-dimethylformamidase beta subunit family domain-containing protein [Chloroflexia bacterium]
MSFKFITSDNQSVIYAVTESGDLLYYRDEARDGTSQWSFGGTGQKIGSGWGDFQQIFAGDDGIIYAIASNGDLLFYRDEARNGTSQWSFGGAGQKIGSGWNSFSRVFSGGDGVIYAITASGDLLFYKDEARNGTSQWSFGGAGQKIGSGWNNFRQVFSGGGGIIYTVTEGGDLLYYRDEARNGTTQWSFGGAAQQIGNGWSNFTTLFSGGDGIIYGITVDGFLYYYKDVARNGTSQWAYNGQGKQIGAGWFLIQQSALVEGYCYPLSVSPGQTVDFKLSAGENYQVSYLRLKSQVDGIIGLPVADAFNQVAGLQPTPAEAWQNGCGWQTSFSLEIPLDWQSGLYAAQCTAASGSQSYITFVVKPAPENLNKIALLANVNTWNAYNSWGGSSKYDGATVGSFERPNPATTPLDDGNVNHLTRAELWVLNWLEESGYPVDVYSDFDFHSGIENLASYKALILSTHPEYWTTQMLDNLENYLAQGGNLLYLGGNGLFERCEYNEDASALLFFGGDAQQGRDRNYFRNLTPPRPERAILGVGFVYNNYLTVSPPAPYQVDMADHPFFAGTGLNNGDFIGQNGYNGAASGWEIDISDSASAPDGVIVTAWADNDRGSPPANLQVLARGANKPVEGPYGAHMTYYETESGGFVFSAGSLCFSGSLVQDLNLQAIVKNALNKCLG